MPSWALQKECSILCDDGVLCCLQKFLLKILFIRTLFDFNQQKIALKPTTTKKWLVPEEATLLIRCNFKTGPYPNQT